MEPALAAAYQRCRQLHRHHGRTYYLATRLLPRHKRPHVHALYGFTRYADEIVDRTEDLPPDKRAERFREWSETFLAGLAGAPVTDPLLPAVLHTIDACQLDPDDFAAFLKSMAMDLTVTEYQTYEELLSYMEGSAAVIGTMMLPILDPTDPAAARGPARELGLAFQLTNFIRDVGEDLDRGRIYLPQQDLARFGVTPAGLRAAAARGSADPAIRSLIRYQVTRAHQHYAAAAPGVTMLTPSSQACIRAAYHLYAEILTEVARVDFDVFRRRAVVPRARRARLAARSLLTRAGTPVTPPGARRPA
ncbi:phytoene/squalene synthase family protein [Natronosporangium hydrolyticum]|uniref:Phytoene/squalene synthase family protein n=1 Tax=Natronosporangium hydrolyticum TaxID=2811111 RepID=A0A895YRN4_9ACTN|nr:phytoene/squalene synthase family protein [Natronosporangium hydrolyticum]QSB17456.1 phytoene/squalene synthase family protein [Natronosporangium hydrolyticum]